MSNNRAHLIVPAALVIFSACSSGSSAGVGQGLDGGNGGGGGGTHTCATTLCPNDPKPSADSIAFCNEHLNNAACGAKYQAAYQCAAANSPCSSDGTTIERDAGTSPCREATDALSQCATSTFDAGTTTTGSGKGNVCDACIDPSDCGSGLECHGGTCKDTVDICSGDASCQTSPYGHRCIFLDLMCTRKSDCRCTTDADCPTDRLCQFAVCVPR